MPGLWWIGNAHKSFHAHTELTAETGCLMADVGNALRWQGAQDDPRPAVFRGLTESQGRKRQYCLYRFSVILHPSSSSSPQPAVFNQLSSLDQQSQFIHHQQSVLPLAQAAVLSASLNILEQAVISSHQLVKELIVGEPTTKRIGGTLLDR